MRFLRDWQISLYTPCRTYPGNPSVTRMVFISIPCHKQEGRTVYCKLRCAHSKKDYFYDCFSFALSAEAPHDAALQPHVVLGSATEVRIEVLDLNRSKGNMPC